MSDARSRQPYRPWIDPFLGNYIGHGVFGRVYSGSFVLAQKEDGYSYCKFGIWQPSARRSEQSHGLANSQISFLVDLYIPIAAILDDFIELFLVAFFTDLVRDLS